MRKPVLSLLCAVLAISCGRGDEGRSFGLLAPTPAPAPAAPQPPAPQPPPGPTPPLPFSNQYVPIVVGQVIRAVESADDPPCPDLPGWRCQFFRIVPATDGTFDVTFTHSTRPQSLDVSLNDAGRSWWFPLQASVRGGVTYQIIVWYTTPGGTFELIASLRPS